MSKYTLVGVDGNAYAIMGYTSKALKREGLGDLVDNMHKEATSGDYYNLIAVCNNYVKKANEVAEKNGYEDEDSVEKEILTETTKFNQMIESFECDFNLAVEGEDSLAELDNQIKANNEKIMADIELLRELSFLLRHGQAKICLVEKAEED